jgi:SAM-dependent methyltransferase
MSGYDLDLFLKLNDEWRDRPLVPRARSYNNPEELTEQSRVRARIVAKHVPLAGKRVLEIGCGRGYFVRVLADEYGCDASGLDVTRYADWGDDPRFVQADIADPPELGTYDVIVSHAVWEHIRHPYTALVNQRQLLAPGGVAYLYANLSRGAQASHRYRDVYFPWPHLLFTDDVFEAFYEQLGRRSVRAAWVNHLTYAQYADHFTRIGYGIRRMWPSRPWWDEEFYRQHEDVLSRYPRWDLRHDFVHAVLGRDPGPLDAQWRREQQLQRRVERMESSLSWRVTAPLRAVGGVVRRGRTRRG